MQSWKSGCRQYQLVARTGRSSAKVGSFKKHDSRPLYQARRPPLSLPVVVPGCLCVFDASHRCTGQPSRDVGGRISGGSDDWATLDCTLCFYMVPSDTRQHATERRPLWPLAEVCPDHHQVVRRHLSRRIRGVLWSSLATVRFVGGPLVP